LDTKGSKLAVLDRFRETNRTFPKTREILELKQQGKKVFGWVRTYAPEEVIHAAGILPLRITGYSHEVELDDANAYLYINSGSFSAVACRWDSRVSMTASTAWWPV